MEMNNNYRALNTDINKQMEWRPYKINYLKKYNDQWNHSTFNWSLPKARSKNNWNTDFCMMILLFFPIQPQFQSDVTALKGESLKHQIWKV